MASSLLEPIASHLDGLAHLDDPHSLIHSRITLVPMQCFFCGALPPSAPLCEYVRLTATHIDLEPVWILCDAQACIVRATISRSLEESATGVVRINVSLSGVPLRVQRSDGTMEEDWRVRCLFLRTPTTLVVRFEKGGVYNDTYLEKGASLSDFRAWNPGAVLTPIFGVGTPPAFITRVNAALAEPPQPPVTTAA